MWPPIALALVAISATAVSAEGSYPDLLPSLAHPSHDALALTPTSTPTPTSTRRGAIEVPRKAGWGEDWSDGGLADPVLSGVASVGSVIVGKVGGAAGRGSSDVTGSQAGDGDPSRVDHNKVGQVEEGYYRTVRETIEWVRSTQPPTHPHHVARANNDPSPSVSQSTGPPPPEPAHISNLTPHLTSILSFSLFFLKHPYRFLRSYLLPSSAHLLALLATRLVWPVLRLPLSLVWAIVTTVFNALTWPVWWLLGVWDRWGELGVFLGVAVAVGAGMGVVGAVASGPQVKRLVGGLLGRTAEGVPARREVGAKWETIKKAKGASQGTKARAGVGAYPIAPAKALSRSDSLDTIRPSPLIKRSPIPETLPPRRPTTHPLPQDSWASSAPSAASSASQGPGGSSSAGFTSASASSSDMGREGSGEFGRRSRGSGGGVAGAGRGGVARNAAGVALAEARRRVEEIRVAREKERGAGMGVR